MKIVKVIGASIGVIVCFFYLGCGSVQIAEAAHNTTVSSLAIATKILPSAITGTPFVTILDATGGTPGYTWKITSGALPSGISLAATTGIISGTPTVSGNFSFSVTLNDAENPTQTKSTAMTISVAAPPLAIVASALPSAAYRTAYSHSLQATGGIPSYKWSVTSGSLPTGLTLASSGVISGIPTASGTSNFTATVQDSEKPTQKASLGMTIIAAPGQLQIIPSALPKAVTGASYSQALEASGGTPAYKWTITSGSVPAGLSLSSSGVIFGTPATSGTSIFTASVSDSSNPIQAASATVTLVVAPTPLAITASTLPSVTVGTAYSQVLKAAGGTAPYTWSITSGKLPAGLTLTSSTGTISGVPTQSGTSAFTASVIDSSSPVQSASAATSVVVAPTPLAIVASALPPVKVGTPYSQALKATGGTAAYTWSITSGKLPPGLTLTPSTGAISGVPTSSGIATFTATVTDSSSPAQASSATRNVVVAPTLLTITSSALPSVTVGAPYQQTLQAAGGTAPYTWSITAGKLPTGLTLVSSIGVITGVTTANGTSTFTVTVTDSSSPAQVTSATTAVVVTPGASVAPTALTITTSVLPSVTVGAAYSQALQAAGGVAPYSWSVTSGQLPAGLPISAAGVISGTPTTNGTSTFTVTVSDSSSPAQKQSAGLTIATAAGPLAITSLAPHSGTIGSAYSQALTASGGTPAYTWSITSGSLPAGLTLAATTGVISGTPSASGTSTFTASVSDNGNPAQTRSITTSITTATAPQAPTGPGTTWYVNPTTGGTRYSTSNPSGQCNGQSSSAYVSGVNQPCPFNDPRLLWNDPTAYANDAWVFSGGDTVIFSGYEQGTGLTGQIAGSHFATDGFCLGLGDYCEPPPLPSGTSGQHTRLLGINCLTSCFATSRNGFIAPLGWQVPDPAKVEYLWAGGGTGGIPQFAMDLRGSQYVDIQGLDFSDHSSCVLFGSPAPPTCNNPNLAAGDGLFTNNSSGNILLQDVRIHGFHASGIAGPIGGAWTMTRIQINFNGFAGWNFDDGSATPDGAGSSITANYVVMTGNGCNEEYPVTDSYPAASCYDSATGGFGDSWSGQDTELDAFTCNHCAQLYNTKDGFIGPHTQTKTLLIENSVSIGNEGQQWKWGATPNSSTTFVNNLTVGNCYRLTAPIPGQPSNYFANLNAVCRAAGDVFSFFSAANSTVLFANNTVVTYQPTVIDLSCGTPGTCGTTPYVFTNNLVLGYTQPYGNFPGASGQQPGMYYRSDATSFPTSTHNLEYGVRNGDCPTPSNGNVCSDPLLLNEPAQGTVPPESTLDNFNFSPTSASPVIGAGIAINSVTTDYLGVTRPALPTIGAVEP